MNWRKHFAAWFDRHDDSYLAEKLARAVENLNNTSTSVAARKVALDEALWDYRKMHPREQ